MCLMTARIWLNSRSEKKKGLTHEQLGEMVDTMLWAAMFKRAAARTLK